MTLPVMTDEALIYWMGTNAHYGGREYPAQ